MTSEKSSLPLVSTVITSYNKGEFLAESIDSALAQTYPNLEVIVVDDGSTDNTAEVARSYGDRIRYVYQTNQGQCPAKNRGIEESRGEFIAFLDGDDIWRPEKTDKQMQLFAQKPQLGLVFSDCLKFRDGQVIRKSNWINRRPFRGWIMEKVLIDNFIPFSSAIAKKSCLAEIGNFDIETPIGPDYDLWLRMTRLYEADYLDEVLLEYRLSSNSIGGKIGNKFHQVVRIQQRFIDKYFNGKFPNQQVYARALSQLHVSLGDFHLSNGRRREAAMAYLKAIRWEPTRLRRYVHLVRALMPGRLAKVVKVILPRSVKDAH